MRHSLLSILTIILMVYSLGISVNVYAIPAFARQESMQCTGCHTAFPYLNSTGRLYKQAGYRFSYTQKPGLYIADTLRLDNVLPVSAGIISRPYDKKDSGKRKIRAIHEAELMVAGHIGYDVSGFIQFEAEDEEDFETSVSLAQGTYSLNAPINIQVSKAPALYFDPYNNYSEMRSMTINQNVVIDQAFGGADNGNSLSTDRQNITVFGRPIPQLFYGVSYSGLAGDNEGQDADTLVGRLAYDIIPSSLMVGAVAIVGTCLSGSGSDACATSNRDYRRYAIDTQWSPIDKLMLNAIYMRADDEPESGSDDDNNNAFYLQGFYTFLADHNPFIVPLVRFDFYQTDDGKHDITAWTVALTYYPLENIKLTAEYWDRKGSGDVADDNRVTLQINAFF